MESTFTEEEKVILRKYFNAKSRRYVHDKLMREGNWRASVSYRQKASPNVFYRELFIWVSEQVLNNTSQLCMMLGDNQFVVVDSTVGQKRLLRQRGKEHISHSLDFFLLYQAVKKWLEDCITHNAEFKQYMETCESFQEKFLIKIKRKKD